MSWRSGHGEPGQLQPTDRTIKLALSNRPTPTYRSARPASRDSACLTPTERLAAATPPGKTTHLAHLTQQGPS